MSNEDILFLNLWLHHDNKCVWRNTEKYTEVWNHKNGADSRGRGKQEKSGVAPNKENHVTENKPKQTKQTDEPNTAQSKKSTKVDTRQNQGSGGHTTQIWGQRQNTLIVLVKVVLGLIHFFSGWNVVHKLSQHTEKVTFVHIPIKRTLCIPKCDIKQSNSPVTWSKN